MKVKRYKKVNKHINFYVNSFGFRQPYQLIIDGTFCLAALNNKINIADNIPRYLQSEVKLLTTQCALIETEKLGAPVGGALIILKQYALHKCGHEGKPIPTAKCLLSMVGKNNDKHYIIATQDRDLQKNLRGIPGVPLLYLHSRTPTLDPPSQISTDIAKGKLNNILKSELEMLRKLKESTAEGTRPKKKKIKGPNPMSQRKKKKATSNNVITKEKSSTDSVKKTRKKIRIPKHIKEMLAAKKSAA